MFWAIVEAYEYLVSGNIGFFLVFFIACSLFFLIKYYYYRKYTIPEGIYNKPISVIIAVYKEKSWLFSYCLSTASDSLKKCDELIIVFDGENEELEKIAKHYTHKVWVLPHEGKRNALAYGIRKSLNDIIVTIDSDTYFNTDCFRKITSPFSDPKIGAVSSNQRIFNPEKNLIRTFANLFEIVSHDFNQLSESTRGHVGCMFGRCVAFRKSVLLPYLNQYLNEHFLGVKCQGSDDRFLTDIIIKQRYKTVIRKDAMCYTDCPDTWKTYIAQQRRWQNGSQRSTISRFPWLLKGSKITAFSFLMHIILPFWAIAVWINWIYMSTQHISSIISLPLYMHITIGIFGALITWSQRNYFIFGKSKFTNIIIWFVWIGIIQVIISTYSFIEVFAQRKYAGMWRTK